MTGRMRYRQLSGGGDVSARYALLLLDLYERLSEPDRDVLVHLIGSTPHKNDRQLAESMGVPYRTFQRRKSKIVIMFKKICD